MAKKSKLKNGLRIVTHTIKGVESVFVGVGVHTGNRKESDKEIGLSHALEHMLFKGTTTRTGPELMEKVDSVGSYTNAFTSNEQTVYYIKGLREHLELSMDILADQVFNSNFPAEEQKKEMEVIEQEIKRGLDDPGHVVHYNFMETAFKGNRLATPIIGNAKQVLAYTPEDMAAYYAKHYVPKNMVLSVVGNIKHKDIVALADKYFGHYEKKGKKVKVKQPIWNSGQALVHRPEDNQVTVMIGWPVGGKQSGREYKASLSVLNAILSSGMSSMLFREIREKRGLVYSVSSYTDLFDDIGYFAIQGGTDNTKLNEFLETTASVLKTFDSNVSEKDLTKAKNSIKSGMAMHMEKVDNIALRNIDYMQDYKTTFDLQEMLAHIDAVTLDDVKQTLHHILQNKPVLSIYGNAPQIETNEISVEKFSALL